MKIAIANDHAAPQLKAEVMEYLHGKGHEVKNLGCDTTDAVDYPDYAKRVAKVVASGECDKGILICGTGIGMSMTANKVKGIRCALVSDEFSAQATREHNDANVIALGARVLTKQQILKFIDIFLNTPFSGEQRHINRISKIEDN